MECFGVSIRFIWSRRLTAAFRSVWYARPPGFLHKCYKLAAQMWNFSPRCNNAFVFVLPCFGWLQLEQQASYSNIFDALIDKHFECNFWPTRHLVPENVNKMPSMMIGVDNVRPNHCGAEQFSLNDHSGQMGKAARCGQTQSEKKVLLANVLWYGTRKFLVLRQQGYNSNAHSIDVRKCVLCVCLATNWSPQSLCQAAEILS